MYPLSEKTRQEEGNYVHKDKCLKVTLSSPFFGWFDAQLCTLSTAKKCIIAKTISFFDS